MIDWHSHILPGMDDGSQNAEESLAMLSALRDQQVKIAVATPHFYANDESVEHFLKRRAAAYAVLAEKREEDHPQVLCGAEVKYYPGISHMEGLERLTVEGTNLLLLEMPMERWTNLTVRELSELANTRGLRIVLAHIERYLRLQEKGLIRRLCENEIRMQVNASFFDRLFSRPQAIRLLDEGCVHFIGSDCHNMTSRPPKIGLAYERIRKQFGEDFTSQMIEYGYRSLGHKL